MSVIVAYQYLNCQSVNVAGVDVAMTSLNVEAAVTGEN